MGSSRGLVDKGVGLVMKFRVQIPKRSVVVLGRVSNLKCSCATSEPCSAVIIVGHSSFTPNEKKRIGSSPGKNEEVKIIFQASFASVQQRQQNTFYTKLLTSIKKLFSSSWWASVVESLKSGLQPPGGFKRSFTSKMVSSLDGSVNKQINFNNYLTIIIAAKWPIRK